NPGSGLPNPPARVLEMGTSANERTLFGQEPHYWNGIAMRPAKSPGPEKTASAPCSTARDHAEGEALPVARPGAAKVSGSAREAEGACCIRSRTSSVSAS